MLKTLFHHHTIILAEKSEEKSKKSKKRGSRSFIETRCSGSSSTFFLCEVYHSTQNESLYSENINLFWKNVSRISQNQKYRIFQKRFLRVFWVWEGQITSDKDETCSDCTPSPPLQNEILADPPGFEIKKLRA